MDCKNASPASDMWGVGVITYLLGKKKAFQCRLCIKLAAIFKLLFFVCLVSGGISPFWAGNRYRTMAKTLRQHQIQIHTYCTA
jgi:hypothetical protein